MSELERKVGMFLAGSAGVFVGVLFVLCAGPGLTPLALFARRVTPPAGFVIITLACCVFVAWRSYHDFKYLCFKGHRSILAPVFEGFFTGFAAEALPRIVFIAPSAYAGVPLTPGDFQGDPAALWFFTVLWGVALGIPGAVVGLVWGVCNRGAIRLLRAAQQPTKPAALDRGTPPAGPASRHDSRAG